MRVLIQSRLKLSNESRRAVSPQTRVSGLERGQARNLTPSGVIARTTHAHRVGVGSEFGARAFEENYKKTTRFYAKAKLALWFWMVDCGKSTTVVNFYVRIEPALGFSTLGRGKSITVKQIYVNN